MEIGKSVKFKIVLMLVTFLLPVFCYGYSNNTTHPALTNETVDIFNHFYQDLKINNEQRNFVLKGSREEDEPLSRPLNHFYDPINDKGLNEGLTIGLSAKDWSQSTIAQAGIDNLAGIRIVKSLFSSDSDYSWDRAIYDYVYDDKNRALEALGHNLHLIQDMSVPPHVRNDQHLTDSSYYETFTKDFDIKKLENFSDKLIKENKKPVTEDSLNNYFYKLASFTNSNFFSRSTLPDSFFNSYSNPNIIFEKFDDENNSYFGYNILNDNGYRLVRVDYYTSKIGEVEKDNKEYFLSDDNNLILTDYWNILSEQAVLNGAGVIKLFFDEVEKEKKTLALFTKNKSFLAKTASFVKDFVDDSLAIFIKTDDTSSNLALVGGSGASDTETSGSDGVIVGDTNNSDEGSNQDLTTN